MIEENHMTPNKITNSAELNFSVERLGCIKRIKTLWRPTRKTITHFFVSFLSSNICSLGPIPFRPLFSPLSSQDPFFFVYSDSLSSSPFLLCLSPCFPYHTPSSFCLTFLNFFSVASCIFFSLILYSLILSFAFLCSFHSKGGSTRQKQQKTTK